MSPESPIKSYQEELASALSTKTRLGKKSVMLSAMRLVTFAVAIVGIFLYAKTGNNAWLLTFSAFIVLFVSLAVVHSRLIERLLHNDSKISVLQNELDCIDLSPKTYGNGETFKSLLPFADDLDLFGEKSLFHLLNRCRTQAGQKRLAESLTITPTDISKTIETQEAVKELSKQNELRIESLTKLFEIKDFQSIDSQDIKTGKFLLVSRWAYPILLLASILFFVFTGNYVFITICLAAAWAIAYRYNTTTAKCSNEAETLDTQLSALCGVMENISETDCKSAIINELKKTQAESSKEAKRLSKIANRLERRENLIWLSLSNLLFLGDLHLIKEYSDWKKRNIQQIGTWIDSLAEFEKLLSYACFAANNPEYTYPTLTNDLNLEGKNLRHPLIAKDIAVGNDILLSASPRFMLLTGSNMSGKSTWLRTIGVNTIIAQAGMPVSADLLIISPMQVLSSLRQSDSLAESTSLFMNELKELSHILNKVGEKTPCLVLLDEILRGTNSDDKYAGSLAVARKLADSDSITIMATHDLKLGELESTEPDKFANYCFESKVENGQLLFDYRLRKGIATNRNATWLMKNMKII